MENPRSRTQDAREFRTLEQVSRHLARHLGEHDIALRFAHDAEPTLLMQQLWFVLFDACRREGARASRPARRRA